ncbi:hypothetical protein JOD01_003416 [Brevibacillus fulvus]|uniref:Uncharacterized protein n=1 Tax=Brevibacillus fulvus TaxID=1125967 RepID=A0A938Y3P3_9BACL|nr:hypothetical protein [Brevibacillus fulvus]MBM7591764.1 hypothetical protein [Brevibacillus fulvus]
MTELLVDAFPYIRCDNRLMRSINNEEVRVFPLSAFFRPIPKLIVSYLSNVEGVVQYRFYPANIGRLFYLGTIAFFTQASGNGLESQSLIGVIKYFADDDSFFIVDNKALINAIIAQDLATDDSPFSALYNIPDFTRSQWNCVHALRMKQQSGKLTFPVL